MTRKSGPALEDVLQEFVSTTETPEAAALEAMISHYPQWAAELTDFAVEWALQEYAPPSTDARTPEDRPAVDTMVARATERFYRQLEGVPGEQARARPINPAPSPFARHPPQALWQIAQRVGIDITILAKLKDRKIDSETIPQALSRRLAEALEVPVTALLAFLDGPPRVAVSARFKATGTPQIERQESFVEAVERSLLGADERRRLLDAAD